MREQAIDWEDATVKVTMTLKYMQVTFIPNWNYWLCIKLGKMICATKTGWSKDNVPLLGVLLFTNCRHLPLKKSHSEGHICFWRGANQGFHSLLANQTLHSILLNWFPLSACCPFELRRLSVSLADIKIVKRIPGTMSHAQCMIYMSCIETVWWAVRLTILEISWILDYLRCMYHQIREQRAECSREYDELL